MKRSFLNQTVRQHSGTVLVEAAIVTPIVLILAWGILEFSRAAMIGQLASHAAQFGARFAALEGSTNSAVIAEVKQFLVQTGRGINPDDVAVNISVTPGPENPNPGHILAATKPNDVCRVTVTVPYDRVATLPPRFLRNTVLRASYALPHE